MTDKSDLGARMKRYEGVSRIYLTPRMPLICRLDGKAFHTYTRGFDKPIDEKIVNAMISVSIRLAKEIQGFKIAYVQSDEISILINDYESFETQAWFDKNLQKVVSVSASITTAYFNKYMWEFGVDKTALFDSRAFVIPREDVCNYFLWRYQDCVRNSISSLAQSMFSAKQLHGVNTQGMKKLMIQNGTNWDDCNPIQKYGLLITSDGNIISNTFENNKSIIESCLVQIQS
jgi:tRNA(His) guanylyltransferase